MSDAPIQSPAKSEARPTKEAREEIYGSTDIEADGSIPGPHSMLSPGSAAFHADGTMLSTVSANLNLLVGASGHPDTTAILSLAFRDCTKHRMPRDWFPAKRHTYIALDHAIEQGLLFCGMLAAGKKLRSQ